MKHHERTETWALITGGSSGIGLAFARLLAARGENLILVSRNLAELEQARSDLMRDFPETKIEIMTANLAHSDKIAKVAVRLQSDQNPVHILVNAAGFADHKSLLDDNLDFQFGAMDVMMRAILQLSNVAARTWQSRVKTPKSDAKTVTNPSPNFYQIINIASTNAWFFNGNYSAIKSWVVKYTASLGLELRPYGISATAVCPGWAKTHFHDVTGEPHIPRWLWTRPDEIAQAGLRAAGHGQLICIPTVKWKILLWLVQRAPQGLIFAISRKLVSSRLKRERAGNTDAK
jgi:short-subunit dehydrogenase